MNKVYLIGNLTRDPEVQTTSSGATWCRFSIAVTRTFANADGQREADFFNITVWRALAENCAKFLKKGSKVAVVGSLQNRSWEQDGVKRTITEIQASEVEFLTTKNSQDGEDDMPEPVRPVKQKPTLEEISDDDQLPF